MNDFGLIKVAAVSPKFKVADIDYNMMEIKKVATELNSEKVAIAVFPELCITGYTCGDLFFQQILLKEVENQIINFCEFAEEFNTTFILGAPIKSYGKLYNCAVVISKGEILGVIPKTYICNYNEFYEERWFSSDFDRLNDYINIGTMGVPFGTDILFESIYDENVCFGIEICEDLWAMKPPSVDMAISGATLIFNLSASNELLGKYQYRKGLVKFQSAKLLSGYIYTSSNANESSTDTVFSGHSMIFENGKCLYEEREFSFDTTYSVAYIDLQIILNDRIKNNSFGISKTDKQFRKVLVDVELYMSTDFKRCYPKAPFVPQNLNQRLSACEEICNIQVAALAKRLIHINSKNVVIGISGGLDSTLALLSIIQTFNKLKYDLKGITAVTMPGFGTTDRTKNNAINLIKLFNLNFKEIDIKKAVIQHFEDINHDMNQHDIVFENSQARERTQILMDIANQVGGIVVGTGDMSEYALGWCTYNGDQMSMYGINSGIPKTLVKYIIDWYSTEVFSGEISDILKDIIATPISPELLPPDDKGNIQDTEKSIGPYVLNDFILFYFLRYNFSPKKIYVLAIKSFGDLYNESEIKETLISFYKRFFISQYKRSSMPDGVKVGTVSLSQRSDWRMPSDAEYKLWISELENIEFLNV